ncbi:MAG: lipoyl synthase [Deltaproteobacteria bacterium]|nr:lipoyl synthase [Deltaproteobacteria bacterium]MBW2397304.1 lipoyl synthase [Deltaproteobacteria bacterium]
MSRDVRPPDQRVARPVHNREVPNEKGGRPSWLKVRLHITPELEQVRRLVKENGLNTVCASANCPNLGECWARGTATFMIGGNTCTRRCSFCDVSTGKPDGLDPFEPGRVADAVRKLGLRFAVITCVARDDLLDGGAAQMAATVRAIRECSPGTGVEVLISDYKGDEEALRCVLGTNPDVLNHNIETVERLQRKVRPAASYACSLGVLRRARQLREDIPTKSGMILGMGEREEEVDRTLCDLRDAGVTLLTMGQYLRPSDDHLPVDRWVPPDEFDAWSVRARALGFRDVAAGPLVRSSYHADELATVR